MDLDELKEKTRSVSAPALLSPAVGGTRQGAEDLISRMKEEDARSAKYLRGVNVVSSVAGAFTFILFALTWPFPPDQDPGLHRVLLGLEALLFLSFGMMFRGRARYLSSIDYTRPVRSFLDDAEERYRFFPPKGLASTLPFLVLLLATCGVGWISAMHRYFPMMGDKTGIIIYSALIGVAVVTGFVFGRKNWQKRKAPILGEILRMKAELTREEPDAGNGY